MIRKRNKMIDFGSLHRSKMAFYLLVLFCTAGAWLLWAQAVSKGEVSLNWENMRQVGLLTAFTVSWAGYTFFRFSHIRRVRFDPQAQMLLLEDFAWKKLSWQPAHRIARSQIHALAYQFAFSGESPIRLLLANGEDILIGASGDASRAKIYAQTIAHKSGLPFVELKK